MIKKKGIILMNLGSPDSTELKDVKRYLSEFLMDGRVIDYPYIFRQILVNGIIVPFRTKKSAEAYRTIWTKEGSPLIGYTKKLQQSLQEKISMPVEIAMRYGNPGPDEAFKNLLKREPDIEEVFAIPLYPHYAMSSFETAVEYAKECFQKGQYSFKLSFAKPFYNDHDYINAMVENISPFIQQDYDHILFSYHGVPERHIKKGDVTGNHCLTVNNCCNVGSDAHKFCYRHQCFETTRLITDQLSIDKTKFSISFQSRLGKGWLQPFTDVRLEEMPKDGIKKLLVVCPAFVSDCLETLEEIAERGKETFIHAGGLQYEMIPCLNVHPMWVDTLYKWVNDFEAGRRNYIFEN